MPRILKSALLGGLWALAGTAALAPAQDSSGVIDNFLRQMGGDHLQNPIQSFSANPSTTSRLARPPRSRGWLRGRKT
jgi:hypothetical protein